MSKVSQRQWAAKVDHQAQLEKDATLCTAKQRLVDQERTIKAYQNTIKEKEHQISGLCDHVKTLSMNLNRSERELAASRREQEIEGNELSILRREQELREKELSILKGHVLFQGNVNAAEWDALILRIHGLQAEYAQEFVALVEKHHDLCDRRNTNTLILSQRFNNIISQIHRNRENFDRQHLSDHMSMVEFISFVNDFNRMQSSALRMANEHDQLLQEFFNEFHHQEQMFEGDLGAVCNQLNKLQNRFMFLMRINSMEAEPKENLDLMFGTLCEEKAVKTFVDEMEEWKKKCLSKETAVQRLEENNAKWKKACLCLTAVLALLIANLFAIFKD